MNKKKNAGSVHRHPLMFTPPQEDDLKESKSSIAGDEGTDDKHSTHHILIPTRYLGVSICLKGEG